MRPFLLQALIAAMVVLAVLGFGFRWQRARTMLGWIRDGLLIYVGILLLVGVFFILRRGI
jgi:hypothetical protein